MTANTNSIVIIGAGNLASHLLSSFSQSNNNIVVQLFNHRKTKQAHLLATKNACVLVTDYNKLITNATIYFICVKDDAIKEVVTHLSKLHLTGLIVHCSGSIDINELNKASKNNGVYYPLQSFSVNDIVDWKTTPILIEASNAPSLKLLKTTAQQTSNIVKVVDSSARLQLHLAAVFASNFTNALYAVALELVEKKLTKKDSALLFPLITKSFDKMLQLTPIKAQTGPAKRADQTTMNKHLALLNENPDLKTIYKQLSQLIVKQQAT